MAPRLDQPALLGRHRQDPLIDQVSDVAEWLVDGAPATSGMDQTLKKLCDDLCARGVPLWRVGMFVRTLHPDYFGFDGAIARLRVSAYKMAHSLGSGVESTTKRVESARCDRCAPHHRVEVRAVEQFNEVAERRQRGAIDTDSRFCLIAFSSCPLKRVLDT